ncbi:uroporphyrinogen-III C-methyltransferase [Dokdonella sp.]|uniref:uroporphyrinogen-III C-methyltransferase n=1 Tax=Dokdonella sp. TaxID=2291710 RepID=UPI00352901AF
METESAANLPAPAESERKGGAKVSTRKSRGPGLLILVIVLLVLGLLGWWFWERQTREQDSQREERLAEQISALSSANEQLRREMDALRTRASDAEAMNRGIREEVLAFGERSRALEDAVANLADQRLSNRDAMALNEAEFILQLAGERLALFRDASGAIAAYRLADSALAAAEDPLFSAVRQTISAEMQALEAARPMQTRATLDALADLRARIVTLPLKTTPTSEQAALKPERSRFREILDQFVRVSHDDAGPAFELRNEELLRTLIAVDLRAAETYLFARDQEGFSAALARARAGMLAALDPGAPAVSEALATLDMVATKPLAPALPELGTALEELRNLRTTRALSQPVLAPQPRDGELQ